MSDLNKKLEELLEIELKYFNKENETNFKLSDLSIEDYEQLVEGISNLIYDTFDYTF